MSQKFFFRTPCLTPIINKKLAFPSSSLFTNSSWSALLLAHVHLSTCIVKGSLKGLGDILGLEEITKISPVKSITGVKSIQEVTLLAFQYNLQQDGNMIWYIIYDISLKVKKITPINEDIALNAINNWQLKNLIKDESVELLESEIEEEEAKELLLERIKEHHRQRERQLREALAIRLGKVPSNLFM